MFDRSERPQNYAVRQVEYLRLDGADFKRKVGVPLETAMESEIELLREFGLAQMVGPDLILSEDGICFTSAVKRVFFHESAWKRLSEMAPEDFNIERGLLPVLGSNENSIGNLNSTQLTSL